jgi:hypothetical protein
MAHQSGCHCSNRDDHGNAAIQGISNSGEEFPAIIKAAAKPPMT